MPDFQQPVAAQEAEKEDTLENLTPFERQMMMKHRISWLFWEIAHASHSVCRVKRLLELCSGDATLMMSFFGLAGTFNNLFAMIISPLIGSLSDAYGRKYIVAAGRLGTALFFISTAPGMPWLRAGGEAAMRAQAFLNVVSWGIIMPGNIAVQLAMADDLWGSRPKLSALINAANSIPQNISGVIAPFLGALMNTYCHWLGFWGPFGLMVATSLLWATGPETLTEEKKKPFTMGKANPFKAIKLLLSNGVGLRRMSLAAGVFFAVIPGCWNFRTGYRTLNTQYGMNMTPNETGYFDALNFGWNAISAKFVIPPMLESWGNKLAFERWSWIAIACHLLVSQSWRPAGASKLRMVLQYAIPAMLVSHPWGEVCNGSLRAMIIKQGIEVTDAGRGELSSAYDCMIQLAQIPTPILWSWLFSKFGNAAQGTLLGSIGPGTPPRPVPVYSA